MLGPRKPSKICFYCAFLTPQFLIGSRGGDQPPTPIFLFGKYSIFFFQISFVFLTLIYSSQFYHFPYFEIWAIINFKNTHFDGFCLPKPNHSSFSFYT